jgi:hypothetical protein
MACFQSRSFADGRAVRLDPLIDTIAVYLVDGARIGCDRAPIAARAASSASTALRAAAGPSRRST